MTELETSRKSSSQEERLDRGKHRKRIIRANLRDSGSEKAMYLFVLLILVHLMIKAGGGGGGGDIHSARVDYSSLLARGKSTPFVKPLPLARRL